MSIREAYFVSAGFVGGGGFRISGGGLGLGCPASGSGPGLSLVGLDITSSLMASPKTVSVRGD